VAGLALDMPLSARPHLAVVVLEDSPERRIQAAEVVLLVALVVLVLLIFVIRGHQGGPAELSHL
jgi:hypothetical protein